MSATVAGVWLTFVGVFAAGLSLQPCASLPGAASWMGTRLNLVHYSSACPAGTFMVSGERIATVMISVALPVVVGYVLAMFAGAGLGVAVRGAWVRLSRLVLCAVRALVRPLQVTGRQRPTPSLTFAPVAHAVRSPALGAIARRGPPVLAA